MCYFKSAVCAYNSTTRDVAVYLSNETDSHHAIREEYGLQTRDTDGMGRYQTPVEYKPVRSLMDEAGWEFQFDAGRPNWWEDWMTPRVKNQMFRAAMRHFDGNTLEVDGDLNLGSLTTLPEGVTLNADGYLDLRSLTTIPEGVTLKTDSYLNLGSLTTISGGVTLTADSYLDLGSLTTIPGGVTLKTDSYLDLRSLTTISEGVTLTADSYLDLRSLTTIPEGVTLKARSIRNGRRWLSTAEYLASMKD